ncbi:SRPBCC family protein [Chryseobacterium gwangjuense]|uniref:SRPBCC family protein n=1 Tax=Chryseobacterium gwangjuense TaxID=1069980 RepID=UPI001E42AFAC|nr:SRPBCC domain-containing protein [Chryseobacterium gwangjuense]MCE3076165.1 SRPBCC domain-containing protein [Chryseobacterium gwangjuense]
MSTQNFSYTFTTSKPTNEVFNILINPKQWWMGLHDEIITGKSEQPNDVFIFDAGNGVHHTEQKLIEVIPDQKIVWEVTDSNLTFANKTDEWTGTKIGFDISPEDNNTRVVFTHDGLTPEFECYGGCSSAWTQYLEKLEKELN